MKEFTSVYEFMQEYPDEEAAVEFFERRRWADQPTCPHCGSQSTRRTKDAKPMPHRCRDCRKHFSVRTGTLMQHTRFRSTSG